MPKTLADMTPEERANFVGMWCEISGESWPYVLVGAYTNGYAFLYAPSVAHEFCTALENVTPLLDYPRAWQADGTPVKGKWIEAEYLGASHGLTHCYYFDSIEPTHRFFETEWEPIPEDHQ